MEHNNIIKKLIFYIEGSLPENEMKHIAEHLDVCTECRLFFEELKLNMEVLDADKHIEPNPFFYTKLKTKLEGEKNMLVKAFSKYLQPAFFILILALGINFGIWMGSQYSTLDTSYSQEASLIPLDDISDEPIEQFLINFE